MISAENLSQDPWSRYYLKKPTTSLTPKPLCEKGIFPHQICALGFVLDGPCASLWHASFLLFQPCRLGLGLVLSSQERCWGLPAWCCGSRALSTTIGQGGGTPAAGFCASLEVTQEEQSAFPGLSSLHMVRSSLISFSESCRLGVFLQGCLSPASTRSSVWPPGPVPGARLYCKAR